LEATYVKWAGEKREIAEISKSFAHDAFSAQDAGGHGLNKGTF
jgi:hypothetical protein